MNIPVIAAVRKTPSVESSTPCFITGLVSASEVSSPPANRIMVIAKWPMDSASSKSSNSRPSPSSPASIPRSRNRSKVGVPMRVPSLVIRIAANTSIEASNSRLSDSRLTEKIERGNVIRLLFRTGSGIRSS